ncbi:MAG: ATP-binding protein [Persicimonas sp.]
MNAPLDAKPRLRTIFVLVNLVVLLIPLGGIGVLRIYETELVRRTESELISQGALVQAMYRDRLDEVLDEECNWPEEKTPYGVSAHIDWPVNIDDKFRPIPADLELAGGRVFSPVPDPVPPRVDVDRCATIVGEEMEPILRDAQQITLSGIHLLDYRGSVVASTQESADEMALINRDDVKRALDGEFVKILRRRTAPPETWSLESIQRRAQVRVFVTMPIVRKGRVVGAVSMVRTPMSLLEGLYENRLIFAALIGAILLASLIISIIAAFFVVRPIRRLIEQTRRVAREEDEATEPLERPGTREVDELSRAFADMAGTLNERAEYIETFARHLSHEFKTPISSIQGTVELLQDHVETMSDEERDRFLEMLADDASHMEQMVNRLLDLARADMLEPSDARTDLGEVLSHIAQRYSDLHVEVSNEADIEEVPIEPETLESILGNLIENADQHGADRVEIRVDEPDEGGVELVVSDDGPGISEGNRDKIFEAFFTTRRSEGGTGLGLAISRSLMRAHGGDIELLDRDEGAHFRLWLPAGG